MSAPLMPGDGDPRHGTNGYSNLGCRCDVCRDANSKWQRGARVRRSASVALLPASHHGSESTYTNYRCRCRACKDAHAESARKRTGADA